MSAPSEKRKTAAVDFSRRELLRSFAAGTMVGMAGYPFTGLAAEPPTNQEEPGRFGPICAFAKHLQHLTHGQLADFLVEAGFDGIEATVRRGGQVEPENVERDLPPLVEALARRKRRVVLMATDINDAADPLAHRVLKTAAGLGIRNYRLKWYKYDLERPIMPQLEEFRGNVQRMAELNAKFGMTGLYQNHAGRNYVGASIWDLHHLLQGIPKDQIAAAFDVRHVTVEGGQCWPTLWRLICDSVGCLYFKDFRWEGQETVNVPFGEGRVSPQLIALVRREAPEHVPVSLHVEYYDHSDPALQEKCLAAFRQDRKTLRAWLGS